MENTLRVGSEPIPGSQQEQSKYKLALMAAISGAAIFVSTACGGSQAETNSETVAVEEVTPSPEVSATPSETPVEASPSPEAQAFPEREATGELFEFQQLNVGEEVLVYHGFFFLMRNDPAYEDSGYFGMGAFNPLVQKDTEGNLWLGVQNIENDGHSASPDTVRWINTSHSQITNLDIYTAPDVYSSEELVTQEEFAGDGQVATGGDAYRNGTVLCVDDCETGSGQSFSFWMTEWYNADQADIVGSPMNYMQTDPSMYDHHLNMAGNKYGYTAVSPDEVIDSFPE